MNGKTGFVVDSIEAMIEAVGLIDQVDPGECLRHVQDRFSITCMTHKYLELYHQIIDSHKMIESSMRFSDIRPPIPHNQSIMVI